MDMDHVTQTAGDNPYVAQADRLADSLRHLASTFLTLESPREEFSRQELEGMFEQVTAKVCVNCRRRESCLKQDQEELHRLLFEILCTVEEYGVELNTEMKRKLQRHCIQAPRFLRETLEAFQEAKRLFVWNHKMAQSREGCAVQLDTFAQLLRHATRELDASIFTDPPLERRLRTRLRREGIRMLSSVFFVDARGHYEIHLTVKPEKGSCVPTRALAQIVSQCARRRMDPAKDERPVLAQEYCTVVFMEGPGYYTLQGTAHAGKDGAEVSGDSFLLTQLPGGQEAAVLSDGMGSGERAGRESAMVVEMLEELLKSGFPRQTALSMMNTALVMGREEVIFSTLDMCVFDLYTASCDFVKAGAAPTFLRRGRTVRRITAESLPLGVVREQKIAEQRVDLQPGDMVVMVTDGVLDALPEAEQESLLDLLIGGNQLENPQELAEHILDQVLQLASGAPQDDMTVLAVGIWEV